MSKNQDISLSAFDWDDSELIKAYDRGLSLKGKGNKHGSPKVDKQKSKKIKEWKVGDYCSAEYYGDGLFYEAKIVEIFDDVCIVDFLGYDEQVEIALDSLSKSHGKKARKKQLKKGESFAESSANESVSVDDTVNESSVNQSPSLKRSKKKHHRKNHGNYALDQTADYTAAANTSHSVQPVAYYNNEPPVTMVPPPPPMPQCPEAAYNPSLRAMLSAWYLAGYYTGVHVQQPPRTHCQQHCCRPVQNCCHH